MRGGNVFALWPKASTMECITDMYSKVLNGFLRNPPSNVSAILLRLLLVRFKKKTVAALVMWLAEQAIQEPFPLVESDLIFKASLLKELLEPNKIAV